MRSKRRNTRPHWKMRCRGVWREWGKPFLIILAVGGSFRSAIADWNIVPTGSMKPTIVEGDRIFVDKLAYGLRMPFTDWYLLNWAEPERGDVVVFFSPEDGNRLVKRVVGLPGDRIALRDNRLYINGQAAAYKPINPEIAAALSTGERTHNLFAFESVQGQAHPVMVSLRRRARRNFGPVQVPPGEYFMMGDNRDNSRDSRWYGCVAGDLIAGRTTSVVASFDARRHYSPRWQRFFYSLP